MVQAIRDEIVKFVMENPEGEFPEGGGRYFDEPLVGIAAASDELFIRYKSIIGDFHLLPGDLLPGARSVVVWVLPVSEAVRRSNRRETELPSRDWALQRFHGEKLNGALRRHMVVWLEERGERAVAPQFSEKWREFPDTPVGIASSWSERHAAFAAGLGTFSLSDGLITSKGIAHRLGSVVTTLALPPSPRPYADHREHCLFFNGGRCGVCIRRCPVGAITAQGHDKPLCREMVYGISPRETAERYGVPQTGCGLCQTAVPCEACIPPRKKG